MIDISTVDEINTHTLTRTYDIRDLLMSVPDFNIANDGNPGMVSTPTSPMWATAGYGSNTVSSPVAMSAGGGPVVGPGGFGPAGGYGSSGGAAGGYPGGSNNSPWVSNGNTEGGMSRQQVADALMKIIYTHVAPNTWMANGGVVGSLSELQGDLIATTTPQSHAEITGLLQQLRAQRAVEVTVEARFLTVERNFEEDVGLDLNFAFNIKNPNHFSPITVSDATSGFTQAPETAAPDTIGGAAQGLSTAITYLDDFEVSALIRAVQATDTNTIVTAPRVTLFNGQAAAISVSTNTYFVSTLIPVVAAGGSVAYQPSIGNATAGATLNVTATVSADHKYVTMTLTPSLSSLEKLVSFTFQQATTATTSGNGQTSVQPSETIQEPVTEIAQVGTTVTVPDGGTILLGGQTIAGETVKEVGVPVLDKIPFLKRLFSNHSEAKDEQVLLILVKPTILIQDEVENKQFPLLSTKTGG
jgi:general secretion pathway protein D